MPRPRIYRQVENTFKVTRFKPQGVPARDLEETVIPVEGLEALRLADMLGMDQEEAAARMGVSRPTFSRVLTAARKAVARALVEGRVITVEGGDFVVGRPAGPGPGRGRGGGGRGGRGHGRGGKWRG
jgi:predicted DNA-binding protein (UPF0251 family)